MSEEIIKPQLVLVGSSQVEDTSHFGFEQRWIVACAFRVWAAEHNALGGTIVDPYSAQLRKEPLTELFARTWFEHELCYMLDGVRNDVPAMYAKALRASGFETVAWIRTLIEKVDLDQAGQRKFGRRTRNPSLVREACARAFTGAS